MSDTQANTAVQNAVNAGAFYEISVKGHLSPETAAWFDDVAVANKPDGDAVLYGYIADQAALYGVLLKINNLGITLLSVNVLLAPAGTGQSRATDI